MSARLRFILVLALSSVLLLALPAGAQELPLSDLHPVPEFRPEVLSAYLTNPERDNALLEADLFIDAIDNNAVARYEYRWNGTSDGPVLPAELTDPIVSYATIHPNSHYDLEVRAIDAHDNASDWFPVWSGTTPSPPRVIVAGDSIASGYTRQWFTGDSVCRDTELSYGRVLTAAVAEGLPPAWAPEYVNIAWAGAGSRDMLSGGSDSCGTRHEAQTDQIKDLADPKSWNVVVITAGINSTNWTDVIVGLTKDTALSFSAGGDRAACDLALHEKWNIGEKSDSITTYTRSTVEALTSQTNADIVWTGYHSITGTELAPFWAPIGDECASEMAEATDELHSALQAGLTSDVTWVAIDGDVATQSWAGWPHPSAQGHATIGLTIAEAIKG
jgi:hypothetical protein